MVYILLLLFILLHIYYIYITSILFFAFWFISWNISVISRNKLNSNLIACISQDIAAIGTFDCHLQDIVGYSCCGLFAILWYNFANGAYVSLLEINFPVLTLFVSWKKFFSVYFCGTDLLNGWLIFMVSVFDFRDLSPMLGDLVGSRMSPKVISPSDDYFDGLHQLWPIFFKHSHIYQFLFLK